MKFISGIISYFSNFDGALKGPPKIVNIDQHLVLKKYILFLFALSASIAAKAQSGYNYYQWGVGADAFYERGYTNIPKQYEHPGFAVNGMYNFNPYVPIVFEIQKGTLSGGGTTVNLDRFGRKYTNNYLAYGIHVDIQLGAVIDYEDSWILNAVKGFYLGGGYGYIKSNNTVQRTNVILANGGTDYVFPGKDKSTDPLVSLRFGYEFKIYDNYDEPGCAIDIGYVHNFAFGEGIDGYDDPPSKFKNNAVDQYRQITIGFKYYLYLGNTVSYNKRVRNYSY